MTKTIKVTYKTDLPYSYTFPLDNMIIGEAFYIHKEDFHETMIDWHKNRGRKANRVIEYIYCPKDNPDTPHMFICTDVVGSIKYKSAVRKTVLDVLEDRGAISLIDLLEIVGKSRRPLLKRMEEEGHLSIRSEDKARGRGRPKLIVSLAN